MKRILKKSNIFSFLLGAVIFGSIGVAASTIFANDIGYTPKDTTWEVDNVKDAIDDLYKVSKDYVKLDEETTVSSNNLLSGVTAYDNLGNLITGNVNTDCVSGSFKCSSCTTSSGQNIGISFEPKLIYIVSNDFTKFIGYNHNLNLTTAYYHTPTTTAGSDSISAFFSFNNGLFIHGLGNSWNNNDYQFVACK